MLALALLLATGIGLAQSPDGPPLYTDVTESDCWTCHRPGQYDPDMDPYVDFAPQRTEFEAGDRFTLQGQVFNAWITREGDFELSDFRVTLDLRNASSLSFVSDLEPILGHTVEASIPIDPAQIDIPESPLQPGQPSYLTRTHRGHTTLQVPEGATDVRIQLIPADQNTATGPDFTMEIFAGASAPDGDPSRTVDSAGQGEPETFQINTAAEFGELGFGNWTIQAAMTPIDAGKNQVTPVAGPVPFTVVMDAWFNASSERQQVAMSNAKIIDGQRTLVSWDLAVGTPQLGESMRFTVNMTAFYLHDSSKPDYWDFTFQKEIPFERPPDANETDVRFQVGTDVVLAEPGGLAELVSLAAISEAVGYVSAFLLVASIWTGGMFGKRSRRQLNKVFGGARRRVAFHNFLSYGIIAFAIVHTVIFIWDLNGPLAADGYHWLLGVLWGGPAILAMLLLGVTGALQVPMIRRWNYSVWRWSHFWLAILAILFSLVHMGLDGQNFDFIRQSIGYEDPLVPSDRLT